MVSQVHAYHILVRTEQDAKSILTDLSGGVSFEKLAQLKSVCPSGKKGGDLGWFGRGKMVREFENAAFTLEKGRISDPVKSEFGWHIIKVVDRK
jgi:peptidyl-prolyl cis-trans isomerase C